MQQRLDVVLPRGEIGQGSQGKADTSKSQPSQAARLSVLDVNPDHELRIGASVIWKRRSRPASLERSRSSSAVKRPLVERPRVGDPKQKAPGRPRFQSWK